MPSGYVLYFVGHPAHALSEGRETIEAAVADALSREGAREGARENAAGASSARPPRAHVSVETSEARLLARLRSGGADALVLDARGEPGPPEASACLSVMRALFGEHDLGGVLSRDRVVLVTDPDARGAALAFEAGRARLARSIAEADPARVPACVAEVARGLLARGRGGKIAVCLAGGGFEGLFYEVGALRALSHFLPDYDLCHADVICGISAGAVVGGLLANGLGPDVISAGLRGRDPRVLPIRRGDLFDPNLGELGRRAARLSWEVATRRRSPLSALFRLPPAGAFAGDRLRRRLRAQFSRPGMKDDFGALPRRFFVGATDQDTNEHVVFGAAGAPEVPLHVAIRASTALAPFYAPEKIGGRYYVDGGFTRTTNMRIAVQEGATLVILIDPMVPFSSPRAGHVAERGAIYVAMQGLKSLINGRFDKAVPTLRAMYPHVAFHLFQPGERARRLLGGSPMKYFYRQEIEDIAYRETLREIRVRRAPLLARDFRRHGVDFRDPDEVHEMISVPPLESAVVA